jgi:hypothetical protein
MESSSCSCKFRGQEIGYDHELQHQRFKIYNTLSSLTRFKKIFSSIYVLKHTLAYFSVVCSCYFNSCRIGSNVCRLSVPSRIHTEWRILVKQ